MNMILVRWLLTRSAALFKLVPQVGPSWSELAQKQCLQFWNDANCIYRSKLRFRDENGWTGHVHCSEYSQFHTNKMKQYVNNVFHISSRLFDSNAFFFLKILRKKLSQLIFFYIFEILHDGCSFDLVYANWVLCAMRMRYYKVSFANANGSLYKMRSDRYIPNDPKQYTCFGFALCRYRIRLILGNIYTCHVLSIFWNWAECT